MKLYLSSYEYNDFEIPRTVTDFERLQLDGRDVLAVEVKQPLIGQKYGLLGNDITKFYLVNRVDECAFESLNKFPIDVHILIVKSSTTIVPNSLDELQNIAWGCLYDNERDAKEHRIV
jgi:hypothetical protein